MTKDNDMYRELDRLDAEIKKIKGREGLILKALIEELKEKGIVTSEGLAVKMTELVGKGWKP